MSRFHLIGIAALGLAAALNAGAEQQDGVGVKPKQGSALPPASSASSGSSSSAASSSSQSSSKSSSKIASSAVSSQKDAPLFTAHEGASGPKDCFCNMPTANPYQPFQIWRIGLEPACKDMAFKPLDDDALGFGFLSCPMLYARHQSPVKPNRCYCLRPTSNKYQPYIVDHFKDNPYPQCRSLEYKPVQDPFKAYLSCDDLKDCIKLMVQCRTKMRKAALDVESLQEKMMLACNKTPKAPECKSAAAKVKAGMKDVDWYKAKCEKAEKTCFTRK